jgi:hypothetical protein
MPSFRVDGFKLIVNTRGEKGHRPHCHVEYAGAWVVVRLDVTFKTYDAVGMKAKDVKRARDLVVAHYGRLRQIWEEMVEGTDANAEANQEDREY